MASVPFSRMLVGHTLGVFTLPLYLFGFWHVYNGLRSMKSAVPLVAVVVMSYSIIVGTFYHGTIAFPSLVVQKAVESATIEGVLYDIVQQSRVLSWPAQAVLFAGILAGSMLLAIAVLSGRTRYPKWFALINPVLLLLLFTRIGIVLPGLGQFIMPAAQNMAMFVFFLVSVLVLWKKDATEGGCLP
jgi:hypothetical protein